MGGEQKVRAGRCGLGWPQFGEGVAGFVDVGVGEAQLPEAFEEPLGAGLLGEGRRGDGEKCKLPETQLGLVQMQPGEGAVDGQLRGQTGDAVLGTGGGACHAGYSTECRKRPWAGAVGPAAARSRAARMAGMESAARRPRAMSTKVPTRLRTMWWRKPEPVTW